MQKKLIIMDLDNTLAESKSAMTLEMAELLEKLLEKYFVAVISGGAYTQFQKQFLNSLPLLDNLLKKLYLFPTCGASFYKYQGKWKQVYSEDLTKEQKQKIMTAFEMALEEVGFEIPKKPLYGQILEDRNTQITFSALGQEAPIALKKLWDPNHLKRLEIIDLLRKDLSEFEIKSGGSTSIDINKKGIDKSHGIHQMQKYLGFKINEMLFIGDALYENGNDAEVKKTGVECIEVENPNQTMEVIRKLLK